MNRTALCALAAAVSYTHLDVYKRQADKMHAKMLFNNFCVLVRISKQDQNLFYFFNLQYLFDEFSLQKYIKITIFQFSLVIIPHQIIFLNTLSKFKCNICHFAQNFVQIFSHLFLYSRLESHRDESICYQKYHAVYCPYSILYHSSHWIVKMCIRDSFRYRTLLT